MEKYSVILIDDEPIIIDGLKILIDWEKYHCEIVATATNGEEGLQLISALKPDIVITDISMPNLSGIDMISRCLSMHTCKFIILSGYSDFSYAKQCITLGVQEYLLKPIDETQLIRSLTKVIIQVQAERKTHLTLSNLSEIQQLLQFSYIDNTLRDLMNSYCETPDDLVNALAELDIAFKPSAEYLVLAFQIASEPDNTQTRFEINEVICKQIDNFFTFYNGNHIFISILGIDQPIDTEVYRLIHKQLHIAIQTDVCLGIGKCYPDIIRLPLSYMQAIFSLSYKNIRGFHSVNPFDNNFKDAHFILTIPNELLHNYHISLEQPKFINISTAIQKIFYYMCDICKMPILGIQINAMNLIMDCIQHFADEYYLISSNIFEESDFIQHISTITSHAELQKYVENTVYSIVNQQPDANVTKPNNLISQVENYINSHCFDDLSLVTVSQTFFISPIYLSQTFKKQTGQSFLNYVTDVKINAAKKMLISTDYMVYEIAEKLHYKDCKYFSRLFKKKTGKKPSDYRKSPGF